MFSCLLTFCASQPFKKKDLLLIVSRILSRRLNQDRKRKLRSSRSEEETMRSEIAEHSRQIYQMRSEIAEHRTSFNRRRRAADQHRRRPPPSSDFSASFLLHPISEAPSRSSTPEQLQSPASIDFDMSFLLPVASDCYRSPTLTVRGNIQIGSAFELLNQFTSV